MARSSTFSTRSEQETRIAGERLAASLAPGDTVLLRGDLGMGKTVLARGVAIGLGVPAADIRSPSFTLVNPYHGRLPVFHIDLYRIEKPEDLQELGLEEILGGEAIAIVEWAERLGPYRPGRCVEVTIEDRGGNTRRIRIDDRRPAADGAERGAAHSRR